MYVEIIYILLKKKFVHQNKQREKIELFIQKKIFIHIFNSNFVHRQVGQNTKLNENITANKNSNTERNFHY